MTPTDVALRKQLERLARVPITDKTALRQLVGLAHNAIPTNKTDDAEDDDDDSDLQPAAPALQVAVLCEIAKRIADPKAVQQGKDAEAAAKTQLSLCSALLGSLNDATAVATLLQSATLPLLRNLATRHRKQARDLLRGLLPLWVGAEEAVQIAAFLNVRQLALSDAENYDACLKGLYSAFLGHAKALDRAATKFLVNCFYEVLGERDETHAVAAYRFGFGAIKKLAMELRSATRTKTKDSVQQLYTPQFINALRLWADVLARDGAKTSALAPLRYPLIQIILGTIKAAFVPRYYPAHLVCLRLLLQVADDETYIPIAGFLLDMLAVKRGANSSLKPFDFARNLKAGKQYLGTRIYAKGVVEQVYELLLEYFAKLSANYAFPELVVPVAIEVRQKLKAFSDFPVKKQFAQLVQKLDENSAFIKKHRGDFDEKMLIDCPSTCTTAGTPPIHAYFDAVCRTRQKTSRKLL